MTTPSAGLLRRESTAPWPMRVPFSCELLYVHGLKNCAVRLRSRRRYEDGMAGLRARSTAAVDAGPEGAVERSTAMLDVMTVYNRTMSQLPAPPPGSPPTTSWPPPTSPVGRSAGDRPPHVSVRLCLRSCSCSKCYSLLTVLVLANCSAWQTHSRVSPQPPLPPPPAVAAAAGSLVTGSMDASNLYYSIVAQPGPSGGHSSNSWAAPPTAPLSTELAVQQEWHSGVHNPGQQQRHQQQQVEHILNALLHPPPPPPMYTDGQPTGDGRQWFFNAGGEWVSALPPRSRCNFPPPSPPQNVIFPRSVLLLLLPFLLSLHRRLIFRATHSSWCTIRWSGGGGGGGGLCHS